MNFVFSFWIKIFVVYWFLLSKFFFIRMSFFVFLKEIIILIFINLCHNRCFLTGRPRSYYRFFGLSRHVIRDMAHNGLLPGITKSSW